MFILSFLFYHLNVNSSNILRFCEYFKIKGLRKVIVPFENKTVIGRDACMEHLYNIILQGEYE